MSDNLDLFANDPPTQNDTQGRDLFAEPTPTVKQPAQQITPRQRDLGAELKRRGLENPLDAILSTDALETIVRGAVAMPVSGIAGAVKTITSGPEEGKKTMDEASEWMTGEPLTEKGKEDLQKLGEVLEPVSKVFTGLEKTLGDFTFDLTGSSALAALAATSPTIVLEALGLASLRSLSRGTKLLDISGRPTKPLVDGLKKEGLDFDALSPEARTLIPDEVGPKLLPGRNMVRPEVKQALIEEVKSGSRNEALATLRLTDSGIRPDKLGKEAIKQGIPSNVVQTIKTANKPTQEKMFEMLKIRRKIKGNERTAMDARPDIVIGDAITEKLVFMRKKADTAAVELNNIAKNKLKGVDVDPTEVLQKVKDHLDDLGIGYKIDANGKSKLNFTESIISEDLASQKSFRSLFRLMDKKGTDALRMHNMKRELDALIDFQKSSKSGISEAGRRALKDVRHELNQTIRNVDPEYARVNDILSEVIGTLSDIDKSVGSINVMGKGANKALGTRMRALMSNQQGRIAIENALEQIDDTVLNLGGKFDADIKDLVQFDNMLTNKFGAVDKTSLAGQTEQAIGSIIAHPRYGSARIVGSKIGKAVDWVRSVGEAEAFTAIEKLLLRENR